MVIVKNKIIPPAGIKALTAWPLLFVRARKMSEEDMRHEEIHGEQQKELLAVGVGTAIVLAMLGCGWWSLLALPMFLWVYGGMWLWQVITLACKGTGQVWRAAYRRNPLEREAYFFEGDSGYLSRREWFAWKHFMGEG